MTDQTTFGRQLHATSSAADRLALERDGGRRTALADIDAIIDGFIVRGLAGERVVRVGDRHDDETISLTGLDDQARRRVAEHADVDAMETRGAWALPDRETVTAGWANFAWWIGQEPRFGGSLADDERRKITLRADPAGTFAWAAVTPVFELLCVPHDLRAGKAGKADVTAQHKAWKPLDAMLAACDIDLTAELAAFRPRSGWSRMTAAEHAAARQALVAGWARHATPDVAARLRTWMLSGLVDRFYAKAKTATPTSRQALTKALWRPLAALFAGDWLALLEYLGEQPNPGDEIASSLPEPKLYVGGADRARQAAAAAGVDPAEVERMLASFFGHHDAASPVDRRVAALRHTWQALDELHAAHEPAVGTLWGVLDERDEVHDTRFDDQYRKGLHRKVLAADLNAQIAELWGRAPAGPRPQLRPLLRRLHRVRLCPLVGGARRAAADELSQGRQICRRVPRPLRPHRRLDPARAGDPQGARRPGLPAGRRADAAVRQRPSHTPIEHRTRPGRRSSAAARRWAGRGAGRRSAAPPQAAAADPWPLNVEPCPPCSRRPMVPARRLPPVGRGPADGQRPRPGRRRRSRGRC